MLLFFLVFVYFFYILHVLIMNVYPSTNSFDTIFLWRSDSNCHNGFVLIRERDVAPW